MEESSRVVYASTHRGAAGDLAGGVRDLVAHAELLRSLAVRELRVRYKQSLLGVGWAVLLPISMMLVFTFVFTRAIDASAALGLDVPYALYAYVGLVPWTFFAASLNGCVNSLVANRNLITKIYFPREVFPLSCVLSSAVDFAVAGAVLVVLMLYFAAGGQFTVRVSAAMAVLPLVLLIQLALTAGLGMLLAMGNLFFRDVRQIFGVAIQLLMFISGVVVPVPADGSWMVRLMALNPMVPIIEAYRDGLIHGRMPGGGGLLYAGGVSVLVLVVGWVAFRRAATRFAECI